MKLALRVSFWCLVNVLNVSTHPFLNAARLAQGPLGSRDAVRDTAVALAEAPELSTHFLGKKASWSGVIVSVSRGKQGKPKPCLIKPEQEKVLM